jgi:hypothetical protein
VFTFKPFILLDYRRSASLYRQRARDKALVSITMSVAHDAREGTPEPAVVKPVYGFIKRVLRNGEQDKGDGFPVRDDVVVFGR